MKCPPAPRWHECLIGQRRPQVAGCGPPVVFVHGFGASIGHFRKNIPALSQNYRVRVQECAPGPISMHLSISNAMITRFIIKNMHIRFICGQVYAIDLLGFGRSDKPLMSYSIELWTEQLLDFLSEIVDQPSILVGNSIGSLISLMVKASRSSRRCCANIKGSHSP